MAIIRETPFRRPPMGNLLIRGLLLCAFATSVGCGSTAGGLSLFPDRYPVGEAAEAARRCEPMLLPRELNKSVTEPYIVEPGDGLLIMPADLESKIRLPADQTVLPDGSIDLGKYGRLMVAGKNLTQIELDVLAAVRKKEKEEDTGFIDVRLVNRTSKSYYVLGEVTTPGKFPLTGNENVLDGLIAAGGLNDKSSWRDILLVRPTNDGIGLVLRVDYGEIIRLGAAGTNYQLQPGDRIFVGSRNFLDSLLNCDRLR